MKRTTLSFDGKGINGPDEHRSRIATFTSPQSAEEYGNLLACAPELLKLTELFLASVDYQIGRDKNRGDMEGANLKALTRKLLVETIARAEGK